MCQLLDAFVGSVLNYSCEIWGFGKSKVIESVYLKFCKALLKVKSSTCSAGVYGELGRYPLFVSRIARMVKYWSRIVESDNILIVQFYRFLFLFIYLHPLISILGKCRSLVDGCNKGVDNWATNVRTFHMYGITRMQ